jgi:hypothetical protein
MANPPRTLVGDLAQMPTGPAATPQSVYGPPPMPTASARGEPAGHAATQRWENEGGHLPESRRAAITPTSVSLAVAEPEPGDSRLLAMRARFLADFADGTMGRHHNTFQHRSRVLRQLTEARREEDSLP